MGYHNFDPEEIDQLVSELTAKRVTLNAPDQPVASPQHADLRPGSRWTNVRVVMPSWSSRRLNRRLTLVSAITPYLSVVTPFLSAITLPQLPNLRRFVRTPGSVATVRMWVGLGAAYSASMTFWPYPKTYLMGLEIYLLCLGLVLLSGIWGARLSWDLRLGAAHTIALGSVLWAVALAATETLQLI